VAQVVVLHVRLEDIKVVQTSHIVSPVRVEDINRLVIQLTVSIVRWANGLLLNNKPFVRIVYLVLFKTQLDDKNVRVARLDTTSPTQLALNVFHVQKAQASLLLVKRHVFFVMLENIRMKQDTKSVKPASLDFINLRVMVSIAFSALRDR